MSKNHLYLVIGIISKRPPPLPCEMSRHQTSGPAFLTRGGASRRNPLTPAQGLNTQILTLLYVPFNLDAHARGVRSCPSLLGWRHIQTVLRAWRPRSHPATPTPGNAYTWRRPKRGPFPLAFPYCSVRLTWDVFVRNLNCQLGTPSH